VLLVLDNCEHLIEGVAVLAEELLRSCPGVRLLTTSREPLGVSGETVWTLQPMSVPPLDIDSDPDRLSAIDSIRLFIDRAQLADREFSLGGDNAAACAEICRRLDGVPLAIELAAARVSALSLRQIAERLDDRFALLVKGTRTALPRQQTLRAAIDWSYELLTPEEQLMLRCLSVFRGGFTLEAVQALWSDGDKSDQDALELLTHLVDKSLVAITSRAEARRFGLLETIRQYARERLESAGESEATLARHREWFTSWAKAQGRLLATAEQLAALEALEADHDNLRAILERSMASGDVEPALRIAADISFFWWLHSHFGEAGAWYERLVAVSESTSPYVRAKLLLGAGRFSWTMSEHEQAKERLIEARGIAQEIGASRIEGWALAYLMTNEFSCLNDDTARMYGEQSLSIFRDAGAALGIGFVMYMQNLVDYFELWRDGAMTTEAASDLRSKLAPLVARSESLGERNLLGHLLDLLGLVVLEVGDMDEAGAHLREAIGAFRELGNQALVARTLDHVALLGAKSDQAEAAVSLLASTSALRERVGVSIRPSEEVFFHATLETARKSLTPDSFNRAWVRGAQMRGDVALQHAHAIIDAAAG
jgi:non-specific serine/threonine protein kinase